MTPETITAAAAGAWKLGDLAIPGTGNPVHLRENLAAAALRLTRDDLARLDALRRAAG